MIFMRHSSLCTRESTLYHLRLKYKINRLKVTFWFILAEWVTTKAQVRLLHVAELSGLSSSWLALQGVSAWEHGSTSCHNTPSLNMECCDTCRPPWLGTTRRLFWKLHCPSSCHPRGGITSRLVLGPYWDNCHWPQLANKQGLLGLVESQSNAYTHTTQKLSVYVNETPPNNPTQNLAFNAHTIPV